MLLKCSEYADADFVAEARARFVALGLPAERLIFEAASRDYMARYLDIDIALDTYPYTGGGTTFDALYMGVPVVTRYGRRRSTRFGLSVLTNMGLPELASPDLRGYTETAVALATDKELLAALYGEELRRRLLNSAALSPKAYTREWERRLAEIVADKGKA